MIQLSAAAASEINRLKSKQSSNIFFRLAIKPGGCCGLYYDMSFDESLTENDIAFENNGIKLVIDAPSCDFVKDLVVDYSEDLMGGGFRFHNTQANTNCDCGNSFSIDK
ncbi:MAG: iron-sulfur cluster assembly accessory protein [Scytonematopsis contorta HA4267-MV1]|jgi:iron-sulfur cluster assembly accessory protein|nr:iron-sulfur cluster assembly accessory protein [Scytonematopsis contorta HA4267-MV1]